MTNGDRFLDAFNAIEGWMRRRAGGDSALSFSDLIRGERFRGISQNALDLREYADLRNAIVHRRTRRLLAEPTDEAVAGIEAIRSLVESPPRIDAVIERRTVVACSPGSTVMEATGAMVAGSFSQLPVYSERQFVALLTAETIARWVAAMLTKNEGVLEDATVAEAIAHTEDKENVAFLPPSASVFDALDLFDGFSRRGKTLDAILVSADGRRDASPLNIATIYDVPAFIRSTAGA